jgi:2-phosphoglycerate kinase
MSAAPDWSVLLVGGASGSGKSMVAQTIATIHGATWVQVDDLRLALQWTDVRLPSDEATRALYFFERTPDIWQLPAERRQEGLVAVGEVMADAVAVVTANHVVQDNPAVIEGDGILPALLDRTDLAEFVASGQLKMMVLDPPSEDWLLANMIERGRGMSDRSEDETRTMARASWLYEYRLLDRDVRELLVYHWQLDASHRGPGHAHLDVSASLNARVAACSNLEIGLDKLHLPTGRCRSSRSYARASLTVDRLLRHGHR